MKFARYLEETQVKRPSTFSGACCVFTPIYSDYRGLKKRISAIKAERDAKKTTPKFYDSVRRTPKGKQRADSTSIASPIANSTGIRQRNEAVNIESNRAGKSNSLQESGGLSNKNTSGRIGASVEGVYGTFGHTPSINEQLNLQDGPPDLTLPPPIKSISDAHINEVLQGGSSRNRPRAMTVDTLNPGHSAVSPTFDGRSSLQPGSSPKTPRRPRLLASLTGLRQRANSTSTSKALATMTPLECQFFEGLDKELRKVVDFYREREKEALIRVSVIKEQLNDLRDHRKIFHDHEEQQVMPILPKMIGKLAIHLSPPMPWKQPIAVNNEENLAPSTSKGNGERSSSQPPRYDPEDYQEAKKKLKKAVLEFYRQDHPRYLHINTNNMILNLTGFRKALKKFDKVAQVCILSVSYMILFSFIDPGPDVPTIEPSILSNPTTIDRMLEEIENIYAARFGETKEGGDRKKARTRLKATFREHSHHYSTFRTGIFIGLSIPALISGIYEFPEWSSLLQIYLAFFIPVVFGLLASLNIIVWAHMAKLIQAPELDVRTVVDSREYAEARAPYLLCR
ncbi:11674_t:CDS:10, partial [Acaulospora colombiana]